MKPDRIEHALDRMGRMHVPPTDELTVARIESHWRSAVSGSRQMRGAVIAGPGGPARRRSAVLATAGVLTIAAAASAIVAFNIDKEQTTRVIVADAEDIVIFLPNGEFADPHPGDTLPEGVFVQAGPYADGRIGNRLVRPDDLYVVAGGRLQKAAVEQLEAAAPASSTYVAPPPSTASPTTRRRATTSAAVVQAASPTPTDVPASSVVTSADATETSAEPGVQEDEEDDADAPPSRRVGALKVRARADGDAIVVRWKKSGGPRFRRYAVYRVDGWDGGGLPGSGRLTSIGEATATSFVDESPQAGTMYVVAVVGPDDQLLAIGSVASPYTGSSGEPEAAVVDTTLPVDTTEPAE